MLVLELVDSGKSAHSRPLPFLLSGKLLPWLAGFFSRREAYRYLPPRWRISRLDQFAKSYGRGGFEIVAQTPMTFGIVTLHAAVRKG